LPLRVDRADPWTGLISLVCFLIYLSLLEVPPSMRMPAALTRCSPYVDVQYLPAAYVFGVSTTSVGNPGPSFQMTWTIRRPYRRPVLCQDRSSCVKVRHVRAPCDPDRQIVVPIPGVCTHDKLVCASDLHCGSHTCIDGSLTGS